MKLFSTTAIYLFLLAFLAVFLLWPLAGAVSNALWDNDGFTLNYVLAVFLDPQYRLALTNSLIIATLTTIVALFIAIPLGWLFARREFAGKTLFSGLLLAPMILPPFVGALGIKSIFARCGPLSTFLWDKGITDAPIDWFGISPLSGIVLLEALHLFPVMYLTLMAALANVDPTLEQAARNLGATPWRVFTRVTMPLAWPGIFAGMTLVFVWSFTELGTPLSFGMRDVIPMRIYNGVNDIGSNPMGYALATVTLVVTALGFVLAKYLTRANRNVATLGRMAVSSGLPHLSTQKTIFAWLGLAIISFLALLPHIGLILIASSRRWFMTTWPEDFTTEFYLRALGDDRVQISLMNSTGLSLIATVLDIILGFAIAWLCVRAKKRGADWLDAVAMLPLAIPGVVLAFGYLGVFDGWSEVSKGTILGSLTSWLDPRISPLPLLAVAYGVRRLPLVVRAAHAGLEQVSSTYEEAAGNLGATPLRVIWRVTLPLLIANLVASAVLVFSFSMLEVSDSLILAREVGDYPLTKAIYALSEGLENGMNVASALGVWAMLLLGAGLMLASVLMGQRLGQLFRVSGD